MSITQLTKLFNGDFIDKLSLNEEIPFLLKGTKIYIEVKCWLKDTRF